MACCQCQGIERLFGRQEAQRKLRAYARHGPDRTTRLLLDAVKGEHIEGATLLDIGGGVGVAHLELLSAGLRSATDVDASSAYLDGAREEARRRGYGDRVTYHHGDFVRVGSGDRACRYRHAGSRNLLLSRYARAGESVCR
jgi:16S rRNA G966 N2-methylase RsmD